MSPEKSKNTFENLKEVNYIEYRLDDTPFDEAERSRLRDGFGQSGGKFIVYKEISSPENIFIGLFKNFYLVDHSQCWRRVETVLGEGYELVDAGGANFSEKGSEFLSGNSYSLKDELDKDTQNECRTMMNATLEIDVRQIS